MLSELISRVNIVICGDSDVLMSELELEIREKKLSIISYKTKEDEKSLSVSDVNDMMYHTNLKSSNKCYILINKNIRNTNIQNSLLKTLEDSNKNYIFVIFVPSINHLLGTVLSRSVVINKLSIKNQFSEVKKKLIISKNIKNLIKILYIEDKYMRGLLGDKQVKDFVNMV